MFLIVPEQKRLENLIINCLVNYLIVEPVKFEGLVEVIKSGVSIALKLNC